MTEYLDFAKDVARDAGTIMRQHFLADTGVTLKSDETPVTVADIAINAMVIDRVAARFPDHSVQGEEQTMDKQSRYVWSCDPIDGTHYFSMGIALSTFMLALVKDGEPQVAVIYEPNTDQMLTAEKGKGAFNNGKRIHVNADTLAKANPNVRVDVGETKDHPLGDLKGLRDELYDRGIKVGGIRVSGIQAFLVATGALALAVSPATEPHDAAAPKLIVEEAGGRATDFYGDDQVYNGPINGMVYSNSIVHDEVVAILKRTV